MKSTKKLFFLLILAIVTITSCQPELKSDFSTSTDSVMVGEVVYFNDKSSGFHHRWDFGDGTNANINNPTHIYDRSGEYVVSLQVSDKKDRSVETSEQTIFVFDSKYNHLVDSTNKVLDSLRALIIGEWKIVYFGLNYSENETYTDSLSSMNFLANGYTSYTNSGITSPTDEWDLIRPDRFKLKTESRDIEYIIRKLDRDNFIFYKLEHGNGGYDTITTAQIR